MHHHSHPSGEGHLEGKEQERISPANTINSAMKMSRTAIILVIVILAGVALFAGCTDTPRGSPLPAGKDNPLVGAWVSREAGLSTIYRFWENGTFDAWSRSEDIRPKYVYTSKGNWEVRGVNEYSTEGEHIGYGEVTTLAIRRILTLVYDPSSDTLTIAEYKNQVFARLSHDPDAPLGHPVSFNR